MTSRANPYGITIAFRNAVMPYINHQIVTDCTTLGLGWVRVQMLWSDIEQKTGVYDPHNIDVLDDAVKRITQAGMHVQFAIQQPPTWHMVTQNCSPPGTTNGTWFMPDPQSMANFANFLSKRYNGVTNIPNYGPLLIDAFEIGNEEFDNHFSQGSPVTVAGQPCRDAKWFIPCLKAASPVIRANSPNSLVGMCGLWWEFSDHRISFMQEMYAAGCKSFFDYANFHFYPDPLPPDQDTNSTRLSLAGQTNEIYNVMSANGDGTKSVWITEFGYPVTPVGTLSDATRATYMTKAFDIMRTNTHVGVCNIYTMNYTNPTLNANSQSFSLTQYNAPHYTQTFFAVQSYITKYPTWPGGGPPPPPPPPPPGGGGPHVCVIALENHGYDSTSGDHYIVGNASFTNVNSLRTSYGYATQAYAVDHPSLPNYIALACGSKKGITSDTYDPAANPLTGNSFVDQLASAPTPITWKHYAENLPSTGYLGGDSGGYIQHHNPWVYFQTVRSTSSQYNNIVNYSNLATDLSNGTAPPFIYVQPNNTHNGHTGTDAQCDTFVSGLVTTIQASTWYTQNNGQIVLWWDETHPDATTTGLTGSDANPGGGRVLMVVINAQNGATPFHLDTGFNHYGLLHALENLYGVSNLNDAAHSSNGDPTPLFDGSGGSALLTASQGTVSYTATAGGSNPPSQAITLTNTGGTSASYTTASSQSWLSVSPSTATINAGATGTSTLSVDITGLPAGSYSGTITYTYTGGSLVVMATLTVSVTGPPNAFTLYLANAASSTLSTADTLYTTAGSPTTTSTTTKLGTATGYGQIYAQGTASVWPSASTAIASSGVGWLLDTGVLEGNSLQLGTFTSSVTLNTSGTGASTIIADVLVRLRKRSASGTYSLICNMVANAQSILTTPTLVQENISIGDTIPFDPGDKLYLEVQLNVITNPGGSGQTVTISFISTDTTGLTGSSNASIGTPGYLPTLPPPPPPGGVTALSVYGSNVAASTVATAAQLATTTGGTESTVTTKLGTATGVGEIFGLGTTSAWPASGIGGIGGYSTGSYGTESYGTSGIGGYGSGAYGAGAYGDSTVTPTGNGWLLDSALLENTQIVQGMWGPTAKLAVSGGGSGNTALSLYGLNAASSTLATAAQAANATGGTGATHASNASTSAINWGQLYGLGNAGSWPNLGSIGSPDGNGFLWDVATLQGKTIVAGNWSASFQLQTQIAGTSYSISTMTVRFYKRSSGGTYTSIGTISIANQTITSTLTTFSFPATSFSSVAFATGDKLYYDIWCKISAVTGIPQKIKIEESSTASGVAHGAEVDTPGYQTTGGGSATITADLYLNAFVYHAGGTSDLINSFQLTSQTLTGSPTVYAFPGVNVAAHSFNSGDKLYADLWANVITNTNANSSLTIAASISTSASTGVAQDMQIDTPGYQSIGQPPPPPPPGDASANTVYVNNQQVFVIAGTLQATNTVGRRGTAYFQCFTDTSMHFQQYMPVQMYDANANLAFSGYVSTVTEQKSGFQETLVHTINCTDQHYLADKRVIARNYTNRTAGYIVQDILTNYLAAEGVTIGQIYDGVTPSSTLYPSDTLYPGGNVGLIPSAIFAYCSVAQALDSLVKTVSASGVPYYWMIDQFLLLWFVPYTAVVNPNVVDGSTIDQMGGTPPTVSRANPLYRNTQYIVGGTTQTVTQTEIKAGDGNATSWTMGFDLASQPTISVSLNGAAYSARSVGLKGTTGAQYYWAQGDPIITQDSSVAVLRGPGSPLDLLKVVYAGLYPNVILDANAAQVSAQQSIDGTSGIVEEVEQDATLTSQANGLIEASAFLTRYGTQGTQFKFPTLDSQYVPGQLVTFDIPAHGLVNAQMLIEEVDISDQRDGYNFWYTINAVQGPYDISWVNFFSTLLKYSQPANSINVGVGASTPLAASFTASISPMASFTASVFACPLPSTGLHPNTTLYPC